MTHPLLEAHHTPDGPRDRCFHIDRLDPQEAAQRYFDKQLLDCRLGDGSHCFKIDNQEMVRVIRQTPHGGSDLLPGSQIRQTEAEERQIRKFGVARYQGPPKTSMNRAAGKAGATLRAVPSTDVTTASLAGSFEFAR